MHLGAEGQIGPDSVAPAGASSAAGPAPVVNVSLHGGQGNLVGDHNVQYNTFVTQVLRPPGLPAVTAGEDLTGSSASGDPDGAAAAAGPHGQPGTELPAGVEIIVRRRFAMDWVNGRPCLVGAQAIVANNSTADITVTKVGLKPIGFPGPSKLVSGNVPEMVKPGGAVTRALQAVDFSDILNQVSVSKRPGQPVFLVYAETGYGSAVQAHRSEPFSMTPKSTRPLDDGFTEWTD